MCLGMNGEELSYGKSLIQSKLTFPSRDNVLDKEKDNELNMRRKFTIRSCLKMNKSVQLVLDSKFNGKYPQKCPIGKELVRIYLDKEIYVQEKEKSDECFKPHYKSQHAYLKRFRKMKKRFNFYENEVLKKEMSKKEKRKYIEREDMLLLLQQVVVDHEIKQYAKKILIDKYYIKDMLRQF